MKLFAGLFKVISNWLEFIGLVMRHIDENIVIFMTEFSYHLIIMTFKSVDYSKTHLFIWRILSLAYIFEMKKYKFFKTAEGLFRVRPMIFRKCYVEIIRKSVLR